MRHPFQESDIVLLFSFILTENKNVFIFISVKNLMFFFFSSTKNLMFFFFISIIMDSLPRDGKDVRHVHAAAASGSLQHLDEDLKEPSEPGQSRQRAKEEELFSGTNIFPGTNIFSGVNFFPGANIFSWY